MANYCDNRLTVQGNQKEIDRFKKIVRKSKKNNLDFNRTVPMPTELLNTQSPSNDKQVVKELYQLKFGYDNWYDWQHANWGVKWGPSYADVMPPAETTYKNGNKKIVYDFTTPWAPPTLWIINSSLLFPTLTFKNFYVEEGMGFKGSDTIINGEVTKRT